MTNCFWKCWCPSPSRTTQVATHRPRPQSVVAAARPERSPRSQIVHHPSGAAGCPVAWPCRRWS
eukprot:7539605-Alexandrium_andersonii.AAC.1